MSRALVIGYGSIGQRHARLLMELGQTVDLVSRHADGAFRSIEDALTRRPAYVVIADETTRHHDSLKALVQGGFRGKVLVEKPLFATPLELPSHDFQVFGVGYNLRFHPILTKIREILAKEPPLTLALACSSYLPDWRAGGDYQTSYSARKNKGGGVLRDLSHELDLALWLGGNWQKTTALGGNLGALGIESDEAFSLLASSQQCPHVSLHVDYLNRSHLRRLNISTASYGIEADLVHGTLMLNGNSEHYDIKIDDTYRAMHQDMLDHNTTTLCSPDEGLAVMDWIAAAEKASAAGVWISR